MFDRLRLYASLGAASAGMLALAAEAPDARAAEPEPPNFLVITSDDMSFETPGHTGNTTPDITPHIDRLAREGIRFEHAFVTCAICQPSRSVLITGRLPHRNGAIGFNPIIDDVPQLGGLLREAGYRTGIVHKVSHHAPTTARDWDEIVNHLPGQGRDAGEYGRYVSEFIDESGEGEQPFFLLMNIHDPHRPLAGSPKEQRRFRGVDLTPPSRTYEPHEVDVPEWMPDTPHVRQELAYYYNGSKRADDIVGAMLEALEASGAADNTVTIYLSDHGMPLIFAKGNVYRQSVQTPLLIRWPGKIKPGSVDKRHFVNGFDFMPTVLDLAGLEAPELVYGASYAPILFGEELEGRDAGYGMHLRGHTHTLGQRAIHTGDFGYIYNEWAAWGRAGQVFIADNNVSLLTVGAEDDPRQAARLDFYLNRPAEELYDYRNDPWALNNLADDPDHYEALRRMRERMKTWLDSTGDPARNSFFQWVNGHPKVDAIGPNLLGNGGFEQGTPGGELPEWGVLDALTRLVQDAAEGERAVLLDDNNPTPGENATLTSERYPVEAGQVYRARLRARTTGANEASAHLRFFDAQGGFIDQSSYDLPAETAVYRVHEFASPTVPEDAATMDFFVYTRESSTGQVWLDDISVRRIR